MRYLEAFIITSLMFLILTVSPIIHENFCERNKDAVQCEIRKHMQNKEYTGIWCDPIEKNDCKVNDLIRTDVAECHLANQEDQGELNPLLRCFPKATEPMAVEKRIISLSDGDPRCVPTIYRKRMICGQRGSRCVCDSGIPGSWPARRFNCYCQWFVDYCIIPNVCSDKTLCDTMSGSLECPGGSINHCSVNPYLCQDKNAYCVELDDRNMKWLSGTEIVGEGFSCINKNAFKRLQSLAPFCDFNRTNHRLSGVGFTRPRNDLDYCCYRHLFCVERQGTLGGYLFKKRPCYCNIEFRKCVQRAQQKYDKNIDAIKKELSSVIDDITLCTLDDTGKCNPKHPDSCQKGDLIDPSLAHCAVNCKTGPLLPIEQRSCRIRKCTPPNNLKSRRVIDVPYFKESSLCDGVDGLPITCGEHHTRCVCDGKPTFQYFTDGCRCQYWPAT